jgi:hypothetical protein
MSDLELIAWQAPGPYVVGFSTRSGGISKPRSTPSTSAG